ncbi:pyridoxal phosphate phosphatase PHOSPHO2 [Frankliniella occidentalis]|uniref:Pyridoxal phosphate phosphatase PHOSPHO2 n=1 Tax=Frankliniella occidentalis TaxID=133901 RepID=A0A9C6XS68_FRAOC|nr:pyridoxal phosphate phosphatase PHOSPHO2 [Frankliniella occidentalis]
MSKKLLVAFDFDHTIINGNSDTIVREMLHAKPPELKPSDSWTEYMQTIFNLLHKQGIKESTYLDVITKIPATSGMIDFLSFLNQPEIEVIIISDSNSIFIKMWLEATFEEESIVSHVYTNEAYFDSSDMLNIAMHHDPPQDWCEMCPKNLCKGFVLAKHLKQRLDEGIEFNNVAYVGDGRNDFCPCTKLQVKDYIFPRKGYYLAKVLDNSIAKPNFTNEVKAVVNVWETAFDIQQHLSEVL